MYLQKFMIKIKGDKGERQGWGKEEGEDKEGGDGGRQTEGHEGDSEEGETDRLGETERGARQRGTPRTSVAHGEV
jgi:hypothetical protein